MKRFFDAFKTRAQNDAGLTMGELAVFFAACWGVGFVLPWWGLSVPAFLGGVLIGRRKGTVAALAFFGALSWVMASAVADFQTHGRLSARIAAVMAAENALLAYLATALVALGLAGLAAHCGSILRRIIHPKAV